MRLASLFVLLAASACAHAQTGVLPERLRPSTLLAAPLPAGEIAERLDAIVTAAAPHPFSGTVLVAQGGRTVYFRALGQQRDLYGVDPGPDSQYLVGALTGQMTAALALRLAAAGKLDLNLPLKRYLPELEQEWAHEVTPARLLNHTSGLDDAERPLKTPPGARFAYNDANYALLARILERQDGRPYAEQARALFAECGMRDTAIAPPEPLPALQKRYPRLVTGYNETAEGSVRVEAGRRPASMLPGGGAIATAQDLVRWNACLHHGQAVSLPAHAAMTSASPNAVREHRWGRLGYGYGLQLSPADEPPEYSHSGQSGGFSATLLYYPRDRVSVVVLENTAWHAADLPRAFAAHDRVREVIRSYLTAGRYSWRDPLP